MSEWQVRVRLNGQRITVSHEMDGEWDEEAIVSALEYMWLQGNYSCDCNRRLFLDAAAGIDQPLDSYRCGESVELDELIAIRPDGTEISLLDEMDGTERRRP